MRTIYLRNVPDDVAEKLERLARRAGMSLNAYSVRELAELSRRAVLHAHTYSHRLATIASATGLRLVPEAGPATVAAASPSAQS